LAAAKAGVIGETAAMLRAAMAARTVFLITSAIQALEDERTGGPWTRLDS